MTFLWQTRSIFSKNNVLQIVLLPFDAVWVVLKASNRPNESAVFQNFSPLWRQNGDFSTYWLALQIRPKKLHLNAE